ncbi:UPF0158 family protein [Brevibacillus sp. B_LB10_24]|uniref:UPF0158 family protein n=1 Tax=Brevibacillus sp. B_LB10_24 TaxID=3380645 RepID=UPI0038BBE2BC
MSGRKKKKGSKKKTDTTGLFEQDENFYFIAGYTAGGFPFGITWEEYKAEQSSGSDLDVRDERVNMIELKLTEQQFQELVDAYDIDVEGIDNFLNIETGEVVILNTFDRDEEDEELSEAIEEGFNEIYFRIPHRESHDGYADMVDFAETVADEELRSSLIRILIGDKKIFRRFKDALSSGSSELTRYYQFVESRNRECVMDWLESIGVKAMIDQ